MEASTKVINFMTPRAEVLILGHGHMSHYSNLLLYQYTVHWLLLYYGILMLFSDAIVDFYFFFDEAIDMQIWALLTRSQCRVSDTQVTVETCGPLVSKHFKEIISKSRNLSLYCICENLVYFGFCFWEIHNNLSKHGFL